MNKNQTLDFCARYFWPFLRLLIVKSKRCNLCILSEKYVKITNGFCPECSQYNPKSISDAPLSKSEDSKTSQFNQLLNSFDPQKKYHVLFMLSGGKDSAYILDRLKNEFPKLKILCLFVNNGFSSDFAIKNILHITNKLKVDVMISNDYVNDFYNSFRNAFINLNGKGSSGLVDKADGDKIFEIGKIIASQMNIPYVIGGLSWTQVRQILNCHDFILKDENKPSLIFPLAIWQTKENEIRKYVRSKGLVLKGSDSPIVSNNELIVTMCAIDVLNNGYCSFEPEFAQMIREKKALRKEWLYNFEMLEFATLKGLLKKDIENTLNKLGLQLKDVLKNY